MISQSQPEGVNTQRRSTVSFSGHETFVFRYGWLKKAVDAIKDDPAVFSSDAAMVILGVGKNMVRSIRHWGLATQVLEEEPRTRGMKLRPTELGEFLFGNQHHDSYLEDPNSLWLLHWNLVTNEVRSTTWCWAFNLLGSNEFTRESLEGAVRKELKRRILPEPNEHTLQRDVECFIRTYTGSRRAAVLEETLDCPLLELHLVTEIAAGIYQFKRGSQTTLCDEMFAYTLMTYWDHVAPNRDTFAFSEIAYGFGSPGAAFKLDENSLTDRLERLEQTTGGCLVYADTAGLRQVYRRSPVPVFERLGRYYECSNPAIQIGV
jgi:hypothetical protein